MISLQNVSKSYSNKPVLTNISFYVKDGEFVSIIGHSGAGKTTLINAIIGAIFIDNGNIIVNKAVVNKLSNSEIQKYRQNIGIIFQDYKLLPKKTVFENISFALELQGYSQSYIHKKTVEVMRTVGIENLRNNFPVELSGGEKQKTAIARAIIHSPKLLIADEPTGNLDPKTAISLANLFLEINKGGTTVILSTHDNHIVDTIKKRVIVLNNGQIISDEKNGLYKF